MQKLTRITLSSGEMALYLDGWYLTSTEPEDRADGLDDIVTGLLSIPGCRTLMRRAPRMGTGAGMMWRTECLPRAGLTRGSVPWPPSLTGCPDIRQMRSAVAPSGCGRISSRSMTA